MLLLIVFAFLGGIVTILSPCILAVLPVILSGTTGGKRRPVGVVVGFVSGFTFFTLFLTAIVSRLGIAADTLRYFAILVLIFFGLALVIPKIQLKVELLFSKLAAKAPKGGSRTGFGGGLLIGLSLGLLWTPCVGPILASVISLALTGSVNSGALLITLSYALGTALPMFIIMIGGRGLIQKVPWLTRNAAHIQQAFGILMILTAVAIVFNADKKIQAYVADRLPNYASVLTGFEGNEKVGAALSKLENTALPDNNRKNSQDASELPLAPEIKAGGEWFNSEPLTLQGLRGQIVMLDFMTYSCINCIRTFPYLNAWYDEYKDMGFTIIGIHTPEFEFEKDASNVKKALEDYGIKFPVVQDNDYATWRAFGNRYWPRKYLIDQNGHIVYDHIGEGEYEETEILIRELIQKRDQELGMEDDLSGSDIAATNINGESIEAQSPETYFGSDRNKLGNGHSGQKGDFNFVVPEIIETNKLYLVGRWRVTPEYVIALQSGAKAIYKYQARRVFMVAGAETSLPLQITQDNSDIGSAAGADIDQYGVADISVEKLYRIVENEKSELHTLELKAENPGIKIFTLTFG